MGIPKKFIGPNTGRVYNLENGDKIDPEKEGIGCAGVGNIPSAVVNGKEKYARVFVRLRTPAETLTCKPIRDSKDFAARVSIIENWFNSVMRKPNMVLTFEALELTEKDAEILELEESLLPKKEIETL